MKADLFVGHGDGIHFDGPFTVAQIDDMVRKDESVAERLSRKVKHPGMGEHWQYVNYDYMPRFDVDFDPDIEAILASRQASLSTVFSGPNNSGKSLILKQMLATLGHRACLLTCNRYSQIDVINTQQSHGSDERRQHHEGIVSQLESGHFHDDQNPRQLEQLIRGLTDDKQDQLFALAGALLGANVELLRTDHARTRMSPWYVAIDGQSLKYASSGTRLLFMLLGHLLDDYYHVALLDEPELGLSPRIQGALAGTLYDTASREKYFPHLKQVFVVTHSHLFLDHAALTNNFIVQKNGAIVRTLQVKSVAELHELQFRMLGNDLEHLYMPAAVVVVEGKSDTSFLTRLFALHIPNRRISIAVAHGAGRVPDKVQTLSEGFGELQTSPYQARIFVLLDSRQSTKRASLLRQGVLDSNIQTWTKNGIEWYYPKPHVAAAFKCTEADLISVDLELDPITIGSITLSKAKLAEAVVARMTLQDALDAEVMEFLDKVKCSAT
jgi:predicted ATP-dependent endonuclease of OLD family